jgi:steroid delta-isomerase-like uncharacterized protein
MSNQGAEQAAQAILETFNASDWDGFRALSTTDAVYNELGTQRVINGTDAIIDAMQGWKTAMPDIRGTVTNSFASGNIATLEISWTGTQTGPMVTPDGTIPPSGKSQTTPAAWVLEFEEGKMKASRHYFDLVTFLTQIGAM